MIDKRGLLKELDKEFESLRVELNLDMTLDELDAAFSIKNAVLDKGFIPVDFYLSLSSAIAQGYREWHGYFNNLLLPNQGFYASQTEAKLFSSEKDKEMVWELIKKAMEVSSESSVVNLNRDKILCGKFINNSYAYWGQEFEPKLIEIMSKINEAWKKK